MTTYSFIPPCSLSRLPARGVDCQVWTLARAIDGKEPQAVHRHVVQMMVRVRQQLARPLRGRIR